MIRACLVLLSCCFAFIGLASAQDCVPLEHTFSSGANWQACASVSSQHGLTLTDVEYFAPGDSRRSVLKAIHPAQLMLLQHGQPGATLMLGESSTHEPIRLSSTTCEGDLIDTSEQRNICMQIRPLPLLAKFSTRQALQGEAIDIYSVSGNGSLLWRNNLRLTEDGRIQPSISLSGLRPSIMDGADATATFQTTWRMAFAINGTGEDNRVEQFDFPLDRTAGNRRAMEINPIDIESYATVAREDFRGWRVVDQTGAGYYLDPQNSGFQTVSSTYNWAKFDLAITAFNACETLAQDNNTENCQNNIDGFINGELLDNRVPVFWFSQSRIFRPRSEDDPVISSLHTEFELLPFEWTASSPFERLD